MCEFLKKPIDTLKDLNEYCYYVAGSVGVYLTQLLKLNGTQVKQTISSTLEDNAVSFGLFLQKLNVIRDFTEDNDTRHRSFWPKNLCKDDSNPIDALNALCLDTLTHDVPKAIEYFKHIPKGNESFDYFIRFILSSGLEYLKILQNNDSIFSKIKVKLPKFFIKTLYEKVKRQSSDEFITYCERHLR